MKRRLSVLGLTLVTPALTAGAAAASVHQGANAVATVTADAGLVSAIAHLKSEMLSISPSEKLRIAADRIEIGPLREFTPLASDGGGAVRVSETKIASGNPQCKPIPPDLKSGAVKNTPNMRVSPTNGKCLVQECSGTQLKLANAAKVCRNYKEEKGWDGKAKARTPSDTMLCVNHTNAAAKC